MPEPSLTFRYYHYAGIRQAKGTDTRAYVGVYREADLVATVWPFRDSYVAHARELDERLREALTVCFPGVRFVLTTGELDPAKGKPAGAFEERSWTKAD